MTTLNNVRFNIETMSHGAAILFSGDLYLSKPGSERGQKFLS